MTALPHSLDSLDGVDTPTSPMSSAHDTAWSIRATGVQHTFENGFRALDPTDLWIEPGTFCTLLGPSGSGKTTLLRIFAGLLQPTAGVVEIGGRDVTHAPVQDREIGFVFQHYALFPHLTVAENIGYPLRIRKVSKAERARRVKETLELIDLAGYGDRRPDQLSGGQQQRVAIGRALIYNPKVLLLDEPLGALDRKLRQQLGADLRRIQQELGTTAVYVTHDQEEAFLLSDQVVVMDHGAVKQIGDPKAVYAQPCDLFVANFLGDTNALACTIASVAEGRADVRIGDADLSCVSGEGFAPGDTAVCTVRPEDLTLSSGESPRGSSVLGTVTVEDKIFMGSRTRVLCDFNGTRLVADLARDDRDPDVGERVQASWSPDVAVLVRTGATPAVPAE